MSTFTWKAFRKPVSLVVVALAATLAVVAALSIRSNASAVSPPDLSPKGIFSRVAEFNAEYDECMLTNGARRIPFEAHGWTYSETGGTAQTACSSILAASDAYNAQADVVSAKNRPEYLAFVQCFAPTFQAMAPAARLGTAQRAAADRCNAKVGG